MDKRIARNGKDGNDDGSVVGYESTTLKLEGYLFAKIVQKLKRPQHLYPNEYEWLYKAGRQLEYPSSNFKL